MSSTRVFCTTSFEGFHRWPDAPEEVAFLRARHRHRFGVRVEVAVSHDDRDVEFILLRRAVEAEIARVQAVLDDGTWSCERWAAHLLTAFKAVRVEVNEDGENGAVVEA
jgi:6-pyruvoyl-tetrahydropterin synthase